MKDPIRNGMLIGLGIGAGIGVAGGLLGLEAAHGVQAQVKATFWYYYSPLAPASQQHVTFLTLQRFVN